MLLCWLSLTLSGSGCGTAHVESFAGTVPNLNLVQYFEGNTRGYGQIYRFDKLSQQFTVDVRGYREGEVFVLDEHFTFVDGRTVERQWRITKVDQHRFEARADDVKGVANGVSFGKAIRWNYTMSMEKFSDSSWQFTFDDWMFRQTDDLLLNRARIRKWGITFGEMIILFERLGSG